MFTQSVLILARTPVYIYTDMVLILNFKKIEKTKMLNVHRNEDTAVTPTRWLIFLGKIFKAFCIHYLT